METLPLIANTGTDGYLCPRYLNADDPPEILHSAQEM
jgi:hypothetical protein